ncbi:hypothetical protein MBLNU457_6889t1 [Dothideomycetes sp. NU457]
MEQGERHARFASSPDPPPLDHQDFDPDSSNTTTVDSEKAREAAVADNEKDDAVPSPPLPRFPSSNVLPWRPISTRHQSESHLNDAAKRDEVRRQQSHPARPPLKRQYTKLANKHANPWQHWGLTLGGPMIILFDLVIPCIIYYTWYVPRYYQWRSDCRPYTSLGQTCPIAHPEFDKDILGYAIICFGFGELWILIARVQRLVMHPEQCAPLLSRNRWELDATSWVYGVAMILALIPFVVGSSLVIPHLYLYSPSFIMGFLGILMLVTTVYPFKIPVGINSHARGTPLRPFIYYAAEDFVAVDGLQDREFRVRYNERYQNSKPFRQLFVKLTLWWMLGVSIYIGSVSAVIWTCPFHIAFGLCFGILFSYIACWAVCTLLYVNYEMAREKKAYESGKSNV